jgi:HAD superfamily hydrolase (TIGR01509 family)
MAERIVSFGMILPRPIGAVILDMDGTLHDTEIVYHRALKQAVASVGFSVTDGFCDSLTGIPGKECDLMLQDHLGPDFPLAACNRRFVACRDDILSGGVPLKPGAVEWLDYLAAERIPTAVATSASRATAERHLAQSGLRERLSVVVTRSDVARGKPYPDVFLAAAAVLDVDPVNCLAVEDSVNGIKAAYDAGMMSIMVPDLLVPTADVRRMCVHVVSDLFEVRHITSMHWRPQQAQGSVSL